MRTRLRYTRGHNGPLVMGSYAVLIRFLLTGCREFGDTRQPMTSTARPSRRAVSRLSGVLKRELRLLKIIELVGTASSTLNEGADVLSHRQARLRSILCCESMLLRSQARAERHLSSLHLGGPVVIHGFSLTRRMRMRQTCRPRVVIERDACWVANDAPYVGRVSRDRYGLACRPMRVMSPDQGTDAI